LFALLRSCNEASGDRNELSGRTSRIGLAPTITPQTAPGGADSGGDRSTGTYRRVLKFFAIFIAVKFKRFRPG
jgi:hypothetical protein